MNISPYPGTAQHQKLLRAIANFYADDPRVLAIAVFGSLARGTWDQFSDLDLDVVIADDVRLNALAELRRLCDALESVGERAALIVPDDDDAGDVVLESLMEFSIRYHSLATTSPNIVDDLQILVGRLDRATIQRAGLQNRRARDQSPGARLDACVRYAVGVDVAIHRRQIWTAVELLHRMCGIVTELYAAARGGERAIKFFDQQDTSVQARLGATLPQYDLRSIKNALARFLDLLENDLARFANCQLSDAQRRVVQQVRARQAQLDSDRGNDE
ncbi:MAG: nucleotidyltransferase domain-containing protein [Chloroflexota bacterium]